jgi:hypothetical protein
LTPSKEATASGAAHNGRSRPTGRASISAVLADAPPTDFVWTVILTIKITVRK